MKKIEFETVCELEEVIFLLGYADAIFDLFCERYILPIDKSGLIYDATNRPETFSNLFLAARNYFNKAKDDLERILKDA